MRLLPYVGITIVMWHVFNQWFNCEGVLYWHRFNKQHWIASVVHVWQSQIIVQYTYPNKMNKLSKCDISAAGQAIAKEIGPILFPGFSMVFKS